MKKRKLFIFLLATACSTMPDDPDPHRKFNRDMHEFNMIVDKNVLKPVASTYKDVTPVPLRESVSSFLANLKEPFYFVNYFVTGEAEYATNSLFRFAINSTLGILGLFDVGEQIGLEKRETSHKSTLKKFDMPTGDYLVLPTLGPSSTRDAIAEPISWFADPVGYFIGFPYMLAKAVVSVINDRAENSGLVDSAIRDSIDLYLTMKSLYLQKYGNDDPEEDSEDFSSEEEDSRK
jgi:phospholipid-binding lipoprotein MlaA